MEKTEKELLVTYDFTKVSDNALEHALRISKYTDSAIRLLHVVDEGSDMELRKEEAERSCSLFAMPFIEAPDQTCL
jgi:nucleotide-binding universal stress UspA family protein